VFPGSLLLLHCHFLAPSGSNLKTCRVGRGMIKYVKDTRTKARQERHFSEITSSSSNIFQSESPTRGTESHEHGKIWVYVINGRAVQV